jgi:putative sigma-54 modulation protein
MHIQIKATNIELTQAITDYVNKKISTIGKFVDAENPATTCYVEVGKTTQHHKHGDVFRAEVRFGLPGRDVYVTSECGDLYAAIDRVRDDVAHKLSSGKDKRRSLIRRSGAKVKDMLRAVWRRGDRGNDAVQGGEMM